MSALGAERELTDQEDASAGITDVTVHLALIVFKHAEVCDFACQGGDVAVGVAVFDAEENEESLADGGQKRPVGVDACGFDALNDGFHVLCLIVVFGRGLWPNSAGGRVFCVVPRIDVRNRRPSRSVMGFA